MGSRDQNPKRSKSNRTPYRAREPKNAADAVAAIVVVDHQHALEPGFEVGNFRIESILGAGGFGITYRAHDPDLNCAVAIKEYLPGDWAVRKGNTVTAKTSKDNDLFQYGLERFRDEAKTLAKFNHPNIVGVKQLLECNGTAYMVMNYERGHTLDQELKQNPEPGESRLKSWFVPILEGLLAVHNAEFLHRDIKPSNIYLRDQGPPLLIDFGSSRQAVGHYSQTLTSVLSPGYAPFEQYSGRGKEQGPWTDLYAVGATLYRCIAQARPTEATDRMIEQMTGKSDPLPAAMQVGAERYSRQFLETIDWMLQPMMENRPQFVEPVLDRLSQTHKQKANSSDRPNTPAGCEQRGTKAQPANTRLKPQNALPPLAPGQSSGARWTDRQRRKFFALLAGFGLAASGLVLIGFSLSKTNQAQSDPSDQFKLMGLEIVMLAIEPGCFQMGSVRGRDDEQPSHQTCLTNGFDLGKFEITQDQWTRIMGNNPSIFAACGLDCPVENVSWNDAQEFIRKLNRISGQNYRLPTEAEWEYACRGGMNNPHYCGSDDISQSGWYQQNSGRTTQAVGRKQANSFGLYDMSGNVWEWTQDRYHAQYYQFSPVDDPPGPSTGTNRVFRGGGWSSDEVYLRPAYRGNGAADGSGGDIGLRLARSR